MKKEDHISKLFRESGIVEAPDGFTGEVMERIEAEPVRKTYKPLIGRTGRILIVLFIGATLVLSLFYSAPGESGTNPESRFINREWQVPSFNLNLDFIQDFNIQPWILSTVVALFLLILSDAGLRKGKLL